MRLLAPAGLLAVLATVPLVVWYLLRPRRRRVAVSSTYLWRAIDRPATAATPWQRFRSDPTFWLALLALLALTVALARPAVPVAVELGDHTILVIDGSGSLLADEDGVTRAELARRAATSMVSALGPGQEVSVIAAGPRARVVLSASSDPREVARALARVAPTHAPSDLVDAFTLATALQRPGQHTVTHLVTDRALPGDALAAAPPGLAVTAVGSVRSNVAITRLIAMPQGGGNHQVLVQVRSFALTATRVSVQLAVGDFVVVEQLLQMAPRATEDVLLTVPTPAGPGPQVLTASITVRPDVTGAVPDALAFDNVATVLLPDRRDLQVLLAGPGNRFLELALTALPEVTVTTAAAVPADLDGIDLLVVDRTASPAELAVPTLLVAPTSWPDGIHQVGTTELPALTSMQPDHPLLADVDLAGVAIAEAARLEAPALTPLASSPDTALLLAGRMQGSPVAVLPFELQASDLPLRAAWPLLVANVVSWAVGGDAGATPVPTGTVVLPDVGQGARVTVTAPDGTTWQVEGTTVPAVLVDQVGTWHLDVREGTGDEVSDRQLLVPVVANPAVSDVAGTRPLAAPAGTTAPAGAPAAIGLQELGAWFALAGLLLLVVEWLWSQVVAPWVRQRRRNGRVPQGVA